MLASARAEYRAPANHLPQLAAGTAGDTRALTLAMARATGNMSTFIGNPVLVANVALQVGVVRPVVLNSEDSTSILRSALQCTSQLNPPLNSSLRPGQVRFITRPKSRIMSRGITRQLGLHQSWYSHLNLATLEYSRCHGRAHHPTSESRTTTGTTADVPASRQLTFKGGPPSDRCSTA
jgi:hypothetical protein